MLLHGYLQFQYDSFLWFLPTRKQLHEDGTGFDSSKHTTILFHQEWKYEHLREGCPQAGKELFLSVDDLPSFSMYPLDEADNPSGKVQQSLNGIHFSRWKCF